MTTCKVKVAECCKCREWAVTSGPMNSTFSTSKLRSAASKEHSAYLLVGLWNQAGKASVSLQEVLEPQFADNEPLRLSQGFFSRVLAVDQQTLEHLQTQPERHARNHARTFVPPVPAFTFQRTGSSILMLSRMSSSTLNVLTTVLSLKATL